VVSHPRHAEISGCLRFSLETNVVGRRVTSNARLLDNGGRQSDNNNPHSLNAALMAGRRLQWLVY
jgi:hypothetical protein